VPEDLLATGFKEVWLELDAAPARREPLETDATSQGGGKPLALGDFVPSGFGLIRHDRAADSLDVALAFLEALLGERAAVSQADTVRRCAAACPDGARVSHVGVMLGGPVAAMRIHVSPLP